MEWFCLQIKSRKVSISLSFSVNYLADLLKVSTIASADRPCP